MLCPCFVMHYLHVSSFAIILTRKRELVAVVMGSTLAQIFFKPEKNLEFFRLKICARDGYPGRLE